MGVETTMNLLAQFKDAVCMAGDVVIKLSRSLPHFVSRILEFLQQEREVKLVLEKHAETCSSKSSTFARKSLFGFLLGSVKVLLCFSDRPHTDFMERMFSTHLCQVALRWLESNSRYLSVWVDFL